MIVSGKRCFEVCNCTCDTIDGSFDDIIQRETKFAIRLADICRSNIGWYSDASLDDSGIADWELRGRSGLYFLWHKNDYCAAHARFHMRALYVGKGAVSKRLYSHWKNKDTSEELLIYFSWVEIENRLAKYVEQLLLDLYDFPLNTAENVGTRRLCAYLEQGDVD